MQPSSTPSPNPQDTTQKVLSYIMHTSYFEYLRNHYLSFRDLSKNDLLILFKSAEYLRISNQSSMIISFNQPTICVIIYGEVIAEGKSFTIGKFFIIGQVKLPLVFKEKSLIVMLHKETIQAVMQGHEDDYFKKKLIEKLLSPDLFKLSKKQMKILINSCDFRSSFGDDDVVKPGGKEFGLLLLLDGNFSIIGKDGIKIGQISLEYFGEEILWQKDYQFGLRSESVECRYIFLPREVLNSTFNQNNIKVLKAIYQKRILLRKQMLKNLQENIKITKNFVKKINLSRKPTVVNPEYSQPIRKRLKKQLNFQNMVLSSKINSASNTNFVPMGKHTNDSDLPTERMSTLYDDNNISQQAHLKYFEPKLYRDQKAKTQFIFRRRVKSQVSVKASMNETMIKESKSPEKVADKDIDSIRTLPKTLSVLLKYYESTEKLRPRPKTGLKAVRGEQQGAFAPGSKQRRIMTTMKLHKQIFMREYFEIKALEDKAFKTWR